MLSFSVRSLHCTNTEELPKSRYPKHGSEVCWRDGQWRLDRLWNLDLNNHDVAANASSTYSQCYVLHTDLQGKGIHVESKKICGLNPGLIWVIIDNPWKWMVPYYRWPILWVFSAPTFDPVTYFVCEEHHVPPQKDPLKSRHRSLKQLVNGCLFHKNMIFSGLWLTYPSEKSWSSSTGSFWNSQFLWKVIKFMFQNTKNMIIS